MVDVYSETLGPDVRLSLVRTEAGQECTIGVLKFGENVLAHTLEDPVRQVAGRPVSEWKIPGVTAIPTGTYRVVVTLSSRFRRPLPLLLNVEGFSGIRIHPGNTAKDTEGCILLGLARRDGSIVDSREACARVQHRIEEWLLAGRAVWLSVE